MVIIDQSIFKKLNMTKIKNLFGADKDIYRSIDKVITFGDSSKIAEVKNAAKLKDEVSEYVVTEKLQESFEKILDALYTGMESGSNEVGIWVSGFYGSGKSSFAKYLGYGLQKDFKIEGQLFLDRLSNRINSGPITQVFKNIVANYDPAIIMLDCATEQIKGGTLPPILELLIAKVNQISGYSTDSQLANLEQMLQKDNRLDDFINKIKNDFNKDWNDIKFNDQLRAKGYASNLAAQMYPEIWSDSKAFKITRVDDMSSDKQKIEQLLATIRKITGKENIIFIIDEVGQYIAAKESLILSLQGTMENIKDIGQGKAWLLATAQQTLTEDNPNARLNSDKLYKLNARFPVKAEIEASDIKEICTQRILGKSGDATDELKRLYKLHGEKLRHFTKLENCERTMYIKDALDEKLFINLYPFLPQHFEIIISLLGKLAKITGGVGLRSAIKVIQEVLTERLASSSIPLAEEELGKLATTYHIYDVLKADIRKSYSHIVAAVDKIVGVYGEESEESKVAKSIAVLQLLDDFHLSTKNVAILMHPNVASDSAFKDISVIVDALKSLPGCTLNEIDGQLKFMTDAIINIEIEKDNILVGSSDTRKVYEEIFKDIFSPVPQARLLNTKTVRTGINLNQDMKVYKLLEPNEEVQLEVVISSVMEYSSTVRDLGKNSTENANKSRIYLVGKLDKSIDNDIINIVKNEGIYNTRNRYNDKEINDYLNSQDQEAKRLKDQIRRLLIQAFEKGEFIFRGANKPVNSYSAKFREAANSKLKEVAEVVFDKYLQAPISIPSSDAEKLLNFPNLKNLPIALNHFDLVKSDGGIDLGKDALNSIREFIEKEDQVEGRKLLEHFDAAPFGWSKDTTRFLISIMFIASDIKLRISGEDIKVKGPKAIEALKNVNGFNKIAISTFKGVDKPTMRMLALSIKRLAELTGESVAPLQDKIAEVVRKHFPVFQTRYSAIKTELEHLNLPGTDRAQEVQDGIEEILKGEGSDAAFRLGKPDADLFDNLIWIKSVHTKFQNGIKKDFKLANELRTAINQLPDSGIPKELKDNTAADFDKIDEIMKDNDFVDRISDLKDAIANIQTLASDYCQKLLTSENEKIESETKLITSASNWRKLSKEQQEELSKTLNGLLIDNKQGLDGIKEILNLNYTITSKLSEVREIEQEYLKAKPTVPVDSKVKRKDLSSLPKKISKPEELDTIILELENLKPELKDGKSIELNW